MPWLRDRLAIGSGCSRSASRREIAFSCRVVCHFVPRQTCLFRVRTFPALSPHGSRVRKSSTTKPADVPLLEATSHSREIIPRYFWTLCLRPCLGTRGCGFVRVFLNIFAVMPRTREAGTSAFIIRSRHPEIIKLNDGSAIIEYTHKPVRHIRKPLIKPQPVRLQERTCWQALYQASPPPTSAQEKLARGRS